MIGTHVTRITILGLGAVLLLAGCDDSPTEPPAAPVPAEVVVAPETVTFVDIGETEELVVTVYDEDEEEISNPDVTWSSSDEDVATVDEDGIVTATGNGHATISAESGDVTGSSEVIVELDG